MDEAAALQEKKRDEVLKYCLKHLVSLKLTLWAFSSKPQNEAGAEVL